MKTNYDVIVVGAGPTGIFASYELMTKDLMFRFSW